MTIRRRLNLSFIGLMLLFAASLVVYLWSASLRSATMVRLDRALNRRVILGQIKQDLDSLHKEVALLSDLAAENEQTPTNSAARSLFDEKLNAVFAEIKELEKIEEPLDADANGQLETTY